MLSRIAESLYWVGRYVERAEDTARILDVHLHKILEDPAVDATAICRTLLDVMGRPCPDGDLDAARIMRILALDHTEAGSIVTSLTAARQNAGGAREALSREMWECLNATYNALPSQVRSVASLGPHSFFRYVKERAAIMTGLTDSTMPRDDGWRFLVLGRSLERVDMTARLLSACFGQAPSAADLISTLRCCSAHEAFLRTYRRGVDGALVLEFLLLDRLFPRSVFYTLGLAERCLAELGPPRG